jgi:hypothetical protein
VQGNLDLQEICESFPIPKKKTPKKKTIVVKDENKKARKKNNIWKFHECVMIN